MGIEAPKDRKKLETFLGLAVYFSAYIPYFSWMANPLFKSMRLKDLLHEWTDKHQKCFELIKYQPQFEGTRSRAKPIDCIPMPRIMPSREPCNKFNTLLLRTMCTKNLQ